MTNACMICGPSGIITMKSMMIVNWVSASSHSSPRSRVGFNAYIGDFLIGVPDNGGDGRCRHGREAWGTSIVDRFVHGLCAPFPVAGGADARLVDAAFGGQVLTHRADRRGFAGCPHVAFAVGQEGFAHCFQQAAFVAVAVAVLLA